MVVLLDLDDDSTDLLFEPYHLSSQHSADPSVRRNQPYNDSADRRHHHSGPANGHVEDERPNPNLNAFSAILSCYPIVTQLASLLDLNTLHDLSRTCRQFRANLLQYRNQLVTQSLKCSNEQPPAGSEPRQAPNGADGRLGERITSGKIGTCARDMVGECRRCGVVVCRNCTSKPPPPVALPGRLRRLCKTCIKAPLAEVLSPSITTPPPSCNLLTYRSRSSPGGPSPYSSSSTLSTTPPGSSPPAYSPSSSPDIPSPGSLRAKQAEEADTAEQPAFTTLAFLRTPCSCPDTVWLCQTCGHALRSADQTYQLGWTWRTKYSHLGGLGTGIGEGHEGVVCGLGEACRGGRDVEHEACGTPDEIAEMERRLDGSATAGEAQIATTTAAAASAPLQPLFGPTATASTAAAAAAAAPASALNGLDGVGTPHDEWSGNSFFAQEIVGIGGRRVMKVKKMVRIGAAVKEYEDERESNNTYLGREKKGDNRAWCAWCNRLVPSRRDARALVERWGFDEGTVLCGDGRHV
ncbi:hypothetical protein IWZ03DRAFT_176344 [Phyllosticta citriasiana]|uniref:Uncharacterized protein n=1 Tax=Phyllosticta citriasiana TaxID=595635 RepID=A0ABR1KNY3_9PEZI